jgi:peptide/nickel transport system substrate-binding protein
MEWRGVVRGSAGARRNNFPMAFSGLARSCCAALLLLSIAVMPAVAQPVRQFVIVLDHEPGTLDPTLSISQPTTAPLMENIVEPLVNVDNNGHTQPGLARWTILEGGKVIEFHIRPGVKFQSGDPLTAQDIVFSHERTMADSPSYRSYFRASFDRVEAVDRSTVRFVFKAPNLSIFKARNLYIVNKAYFDRVGEQTFVQHPDGTGPYKVVDYKPGQYADLEAFDGYWGGKPSIKSVRVYFIKDDATRAAKLRSGEADLIFSAPWDQESTLEKGGFRVVSAATSPLIAINFQLWNPTTPWSKLKVRQAIAHAIDGDAIAKGLLHGVPSREPILTPGEVGYDPSLKPYKYDPALAKKLLTEAGYPTGFTMPLFWPNSSYGMRETAEAVALYLRAVGINATVTQLDTVQNQAMLDKQSKDPTFVYVQLRSMPLSNYTDPATMMYFTLSEHGSNSIYKSSDPHFEPLAEQAVQILDDSKRAPVVRQALHIVYDDVGIIGLWHATTLYAMKPNVTYTPIQHQLPLMRLMNVKVK